MLAMIALKRGLIDHVQLLEAFDAWSAGEDRSMAEIFVERGFLSEPEVSVLVSQLDTRKAPNCESWGLPSDSEPSRDDAARTVDPGRSATVAYVGNGPGWRAS